MIRRLLLAMTAMVVILAVTAAGAAYWFFSRDGFRRALETQATAWLGHPVRIGSVSGQLLPRVAIRLGDVRVGEPVRLVLGVVDVSADLGPLLRRRIENAGILVSGSQIDMPLPFRVPEGDQGAAAPGGDAAIRIVSVRSIALRDVALRSRGREVVISADSSLNGTTLAVSRFEAGTGSTTLTADGVVSLAPRIDATLTAKANRLDLDELLALTDAFTPPAAPGRRASAARPRIVARLTADHATAGPLKVSALSAHLAVDGDAVQLAPLAFQAFGGRYDGRINVLLGAALSATLQSKVADIDVAQLAAFGGTANTVSGRLTGTGSFAGSGPDIAALLARARGNGTATITDGAIRRLNLIRTIVLFFGRPAPDAGAGDDRFDRIDLTFSLANRLLHADAFALRSEDADMAGAGRLNLETGALEGRVDVTLSEALSRQAGTDLYRYTREGNRVVLPASVSGTLGAPRLTIDAAAAVRRGLRNEVERRLKGVLEGLGR